MRLISRGNLAAFWSTRPEAVEYLEYIFEVASSANWRTGEQVEADFSGVKLLSAEKLQFDVREISCRIFADFDWKRSICAIKSVLSLDGGFEANNDSSQLFSVNRDWPDKMHIHPIRNEIDYQAALHEINRLWGAQDHTLDGDRLEVLVTLVADYEARHWPMRQLDPVRALELAMELNCRSRSDLIALIGQSRTSDILNRKRTLTLPMIRKIAEAWRIPERVLVREYTLVKKSRSSARK